MKRIILSALAAFVIFALPAVAAPSNSISLDQSNVSAGDTITFTVSGDGNLIYLKCWSERHDLVLSGGLAVGSSFTLSFAGAAECETQLQQFFTSGDRQFKRLASTRFSVSA